MTTQGEYTKRVLKRLRDLYTQMGQEIDRIERDCEHEIVESKHGGAYCQWCGTGFGWWCPESPDHTCYYFTEEIDGKLGVTLRDDQIHIFEGYDPEDVEYQTDDDCLFCHAPDERK